MIVLDANILLYAYNASFEHHDRARALVERTLNRDEPVGLAWTSILAFLRIATSTRAFEYPLSIEEAIPIVDSWLARPIVAVLGPGERHWSILSGLLRATQTRGAIVADAHLAALAIEHGATLFTSDRNFRRFPGLRVVNPLEPAQG